jgi:hypothetical protein
MFASNHEERLNVCKECPLFQPKYSRCGICKCYMKVKTKLKHMSCPKGFWGRNKKIK